MQARRKGSHYVTKTESTAQAKGAGGRARQSLPAAGSTAPTDVNARSAGHFLPVCGLITAAAFKDLLADLLGLVLDFLHFLADARAGSLVAAVGLLDVIKGLVEHVAQLVERVHQ
jgi:hypothetical protein